jgi:hypothetical protein
MIPMPIALSTAIDPRCCCTIQSAMARPMPVPPSSRLLALSTWQKTLEDLVLILLRNPMFLNKH